MNTHNVFDNGQCGSVNDPIVDKLLGNAYQVVKYVAMNMPAIKSVSDELASILAVFAKLKELNDVALKLPELLEVQAELPKLEVLHSNLNQLITLYTHIDELVKVSTGIDDIKVITPHLQEIGIVAANIVDVVPVGKNITKVVAVANNLVTINKLAPLTTEIDVLADNIQALANINTHMSELLNINHHLPDLLNIETPLSKLVINSFEALRRTYAEVGLNLVQGSFEEGATLTDSQDILLQRSTGKCFNWQSALPEEGKVIPVGSTPESTGGIGIGKWQDVTNTTLRVPITAQTREALRRSYAEAGYNLVLGSFETGGTLAGTNDILLQEATGKAYSGPNGMVPPGTNPGSGTFTDVTLSVLMSEPPLIAKVGVFSSGGRAEAMKSALLSSDGYYYTPRTGIITVGPESSPDAAWVCVGLLNGAPIDDMRNWMDGRPHLNAFIAARDSKSKRGGGVVTFPAGEYTFADEFVCVDYVKFVGEDSRKCRIFGAAGSGAGKAVVRACKSPVGSTNVPEYLSYTGFSNCVINGSSTWDVGLYVRHCTNESVFDDVTVQSCKRANSMFLGMFYVSAKNHVSRDARDLGAVIGRKIFNEGGLYEVNVCAFNNLRGNYAGLDDAYHPTTNPYAGACVTIWAANSCAFDCIAAENAYGAGLVIRKGINSYIPSVYVEANGKGTAVTDRIGIRVLDADFPSLNIGSVDATRQQKILLEGNSLLSVGELYSESFSDGLFLGTGKVLLMTGRSVNYYNAADTQYIENIETKRIAQFANVPFTSFNSLDSASLIFGEAGVGVQVVFVPKVTINTTDPVLMGMSNNLSGGQDLNFGTSFVAGVPIVRKFSNVAKGVGRLTHRSNSLPSTATNFSVDLFLIQYVCDYRVVFNKTF